MRAEIKTGLSTRPKAQLEELMIAWKKDMFELKATEFGRFSLSVKFLHYRLGSHSGYAAFMVLHQISERTNFG